MMEEMNQEFFYTAERKIKRVTREEFYQFIKDYPRLLYTNWTGISDPPQITYNDFSLADRWPYSVVATTYKYDNEPGEYYYEPEENRIFTVLENYRECFDSKTGNMANPK